MPSASRARRGVLAGAVLAAPLFALLWCAAPVRAQGVLRVDRLDEDLALEDHVELLRDPAGQLTEREVRTRAELPFVPNQGGSLSFGFDYAPLWLRLRARNDSARDVSWVLEVSEPTLDHVELFAVHLDGRTERYSAGDALPFASRDVRHASFVFELHNPAHDTVTYYLRVQSDDVLRAPLHAWTPRAYTAHHDRHMLFHAWCLGALLAIALYHFGVFALVRQLENFWYALVSLSLCGVLLALNGNIAQLFLPHQPQLANRAAPVTIAVAMMMVAFFTHAATSPLANQAPLTRVLWRVTLATVGLVLFALIAPVGLSMRALSLILLVLTLSGPFILRTVRSYHIPELRLYSIGWYALIASIPIAVLRYGGVWPDDPLSRWALPAGLVGYGVFNSLALAALASRLRRDLAAANGQLTANVHDLQQALTRAEEATENARRATKAKDEFVATMSHELRTPLNMIINIPQGLVSEFVSVRAATCGHCAVSFLLDDGEHVDARTSCPECARAGTLVEGSKVKFRGDEARCLRFLQKIESSGQHLLQMVNGVLDYSKLEAGRFQLELGPIDMDALLREVSDQMGDLAQRKNIQLEVRSQRDKKALSADVLRLKQVLINLVANAIKFSESGSAVTLRWRSLEDGELIEVEDRGIGIAAADQERVFSSFEQVHKGDTRKYGGTGLGLSISRSLVRMHGGELSVRSQLGVGSTFTVRLPRMPSRVGSGELSLPPTG